MALTKFGTLIKCKPNERNRHFLFFFQFDTTHFWQNNLENQTKYTNFAAIICIE